MGHYMTDGEIRRRYRWMVPGRDSIRILAELNCCEKKEIERIIREGEDMGKIDHDKCMELYRQGLSDLKIAEIFKCSGNLILLWRRKNNLPAHGAHGGGRQRKQAGAGPVEVRKVAPKQMTVNPDFEAAAKRMDAAAAELIDGAPARKDMHAVVAEPTIKPEPSAFQDGEIRLSDNTGPAASSEAATAGAIRQSLDDEAVTVTMQVSDLRLAMTETARTSIAELAGHTDLLSRQLIFLRGVAIGAGVRNIDELLEGVK
jgi:hypothetical protein